VLPERPGAIRVRELAHGAEGLASCEIARVELTSTLKRHLREGHVTRREVRATLEACVECSSSVLRYQSSQRRHHDVLHALRRHSRLRMTAALPKSAVYRVAHSGWPSLLGTGSPVTPSCRELLLAAASHSVTPSTVSP
jgi:hypothetical protein